MLILIGPSASGKTEVAKILKSQYGLKKVVTYTTRTKRVNEQNGVDYNFVTIEEFAILVEKCFFAETTYYNNNYYGTAKEDVADDRCIILDPNGLKNFQGLNDPHIISIYLSCDEVIRKKRMKSRKDKPEEITKRLVNDKIAFSDENIKSVNFVVENDNKTLEYLSEEIYNLYNSVIKSLK